MTPGGSLLRRRPTRVGFAAGVKGQFARRDGKLAITFISTLNADLSSVGGIELEGGATAAAGDLELISSTCVGPDGRPVAGATVALD